MTNLQRLVLGAILGVLSFFFFKQTSASMAVLGLVLVALSIVLILNIGGLFKRRKRAAMESDDQPESPEELRRELDPRPLFMPLAEDADQLLEILRQNRASQFARRNYVRAVAAFGEAWINSSKQLCTRAADVAITPFTPAELALLRDVSFELNDKGEAVERQRFFNFEQNFRFAFAAYAKLHGSEIKLKTDEHGWQALRQFVKVRNRLTHPRNPNDLMVTDAELKDIEKATDWFMTLTRELNEDAIKAYADKRKQRKT